MQEKERLLFWEPFAWELPNSAWLATFLSLDASPLQPVACCFGRGSGVIPTRELGRLQPQQLRVTGCVLAEFPFPSRVGCSLEVLHLALGACILDAS